MKKEIPYHNKCNHINKRQTGSSYEQLAGRYLEEQGYQILEYNYHCRYAEIDIIAEEGGYLVFCEVKYRCAVSDAEVLAAVDIRKQRRICRGALSYMHEHKITDTACRFDVIGFNGSIDSRITLIKNAFDYI